MILTREVCIRCNGTRYHPTEVLQKQVECDTCQGRGYTAKDDEENWTQIIKQAEHLTHMSDLLSANVDDLRNELRGLISRLSSTIFVDIKD